jgi:hypothetical protein
MALTNMSADIKTRTADPPSAQGTEILSNYFFFLEVFIELMQAIIPNIICATNRKPGGRV